MQINGRNGRNNHCYLAQIQRNMQTNSFAKSNHAASHYSH